MSHMERKLMSGLQDVSFIRWQLWTHHFTAPICSPWQLRYSDLPDQPTHYFYMWSQGPRKFVFKAVEAQNALCSDVWMSRSILHSMSYCFSILLAKIACKYKYIVTSQTDIFLLLHYVIGSLDINILITITLRFL